MGIFRHCLGVVCVGSPGDRLVKAGSPRSSSCCPKSCQGRRAMVGYISCGPASAGLGLWAGWACAGAAQQPAGLQSGRCRLNSAKAACYTEDPLCATGRAGAAQSRGRPPPSWLNASGGPGARGLWLTGPVGSGRVGRPAASESSKGGPVEVGIGEAAGCTRRCSLVTAPPH